MQLEIAQAPSADGWQIVTVHGEVDVSSAPQLEQRLTQLVTQGARHVVVDLSGVGFLDSSGLGALINARAAVSAADGSLPLVCTSERVLKLFTITGLDEVFEIHPGLAQALAATTD